MEVSLIDLEFIDFKPFIETTKQGYSQDKIRNKEWLPEEAKQKANESFSALLPEGIHTKNQYFKVIEHNAEKAGYLWFEIRTVNHVKVVFIDFIIVLPESRKKGIAKAALQVLKETARSLGAERIELHVFGFNTDAVGLYTAAGFEPKNIIMKCELL